MLKRSVALVLATVAGIAIAASMSTAASAKPTQVQRVQSSPKVMHLRQVNRNFIKPKYQINAAALSRTRINPNLVAKPNPKFPFNPKPVNEIKNGKKNINNIKKTNTIYISNVSISSNVNANAVVNTISNSK